MGQTLSLPLKLAQTTLSFYRGFFHYLFGHGRYSPYLLGVETNFPYPRPLSSDVIATTNSDNKSGNSKSLFQQHARVHLYSLASAFYLYSKPHYRKPSYKADIVDNFRNVAIPGTGLPLSLFVWNKALAFTFVCAASPTLSFIASIHLWLKSRFTSSISDEYAIRLLAPDDWFHYWRLNCRIAGMHSLLNGGITPGYEMENKWTFLEQGAQRGVPVSPYLKTPAIVVKHRNEEGGLGIYFYKNATEGGDWIIQERIDNSEWVSNHLPPNAPLSTFRVITQSRGALDVSKPCTNEDVTALSCVFRAGRENAQTDHDSILFDVDVNTGTILGGTTNAHWYRLGLTEILPGKCPWRSTDHAITHHPDGNIPISGDAVPNIKNILHLVEMSHCKLCGDVPFVGWDVVLTSNPDLPVCLLEVNLSCNFFRGSFDKQLYLNFCDDMIEKLQSMRLIADQEINTIK